MPVRMDSIDESSRRARRRLTDLLRDLRNARLAAGLSQRSVGANLGCSRQLIGHLEAGRVANPGVLLLCRYGAVVGIDVSIRGFPAGSPLRDAGQLRLLARFRSLCPEAWRFRTEAPVGGDRRAFDAVLSRGHAQVAIECITRLTDAQAQVRAALLKAEAAEVPRIVLVLADTRWNRAAVRDAAPTLRPAFPLDRRGLIRSLRAGRMPTGNGVVLV